MSTTSSVDEISICIGCGLCCDGTLHGTATVKSDDEQNVIAAGLEIVDDGKRRFFRQPCPHFTCGACSIYADRPKVCRKYRCALLKRVEAGEMSKSAAREKIATAKKLIAAIRIIDPNAVTPGERTALAQRLRKHLTRLGDEEERKTAAKALLDVAVLEHFLSRWFLKEDTDPSEAKAAKSS
jgi:Fe-S-cluster containining protein